MAVPIPFGAVPLPSQMAAANAAAMSQVQSVPSDTSQIESKLRNVFDPSTMVHLFYYEMAILVDQRLKQPGTPKGAAYRMFVVADNAFYLLSENIGERDPPRAYPLTEVDSIEVDGAPPEFLSDAHQRVSKHFIIRMSNQIVVDQRPSRHNHPTHRRSVATAALAPLCCAVLCLGYCRAGGVAHDSGG
jgi:hypothetical protein